VWGLPSRGRVGVLTLRAQDWQHVFRYFDRNNNNTIDDDELGQALRQFGYNLSPRILDLLKSKYGAGLSFEHPMSSARWSRLLNLEVNMIYGEDAVVPPASRRGPSGITFDRFIRACVAVKQLKESFEALDSDAYGRVKIDYDTFLSIVFRSV